MIAERNERKAGPQELHDQFNRLFYTCQPIPQLKQYDPLADRRQGQIGCDAEPRKFVMATKQRDQQRHAEASHYSQEPEYEKAPAVRGRVGKGRKADLHQMLCAIPLHEQLDVRVIPNPPHHNMVVGANEPSLAIDRQDQVALLELPHIWRVRIYIPYNGNANQILYRDPSTFRPPVLQSHPAQEQVERADKYGAYNCQSKQIRPGLRYILRRLIHG